MVNHADRDLRYKTEEQLWWSDLMAGCYSRVTKTWKTTADIQPLESIWRVFISNPQTLAVIDRIVGEGKDTIEIPAGDDRLFALFATSHGKGPGRMLVTYPHLFGRVFVRSVRIYPARGDGDADKADICWILGPPYVGSSAASPKASRMSCLNPSAFEAESFKSSRKFTSNIQQVKG